MATNPQVSPPEEYVPFVYQAECERVVDGDTLDLLCDLGFDTRISVRVRLADIDTHEIYGTDRESQEYQYGREEADFVESFISEAQSEWNATGWPLLVGTDEDGTGKYGRYLATIKRRSDDRVLTAALLTEFPRLEYEEQ